LGTKLVWGKTRIEHRNLTRKPLGKCPLGRPRERWEEKIKLDLNEIDCEDEELMSGMQ
jgi:hypothetical protein